jgi:hypothetical protein
VHFETMRCRKDGTLLPVSLTISPIRDAEGRIVGAAAQADRAREIIRQLRQFVKKGETARRVENLPQVIEEASALAMVGIGQRIKLEMQLDPAATAAWIDRVQVQQVLFNLIRNAIEAMAGVPRRELSIGTGDVGEMIEIAVAATGPGLPEVVWAKLFQPFVTTKADGMGAPRAVPLALPRGPPCRPGPERHDSSAFPFRRNAPLRAVAGRPGPAARHRPARPSGRRRPLPRSCSTTRTCGGPPPWSAVWCA